MSTKSIDLSAVADAIARLLADFKLPTAASELVPKFQAGGHEEVLPLVLEILELEAGDRRERRTDRLRRASHLPPGKTLATLDEKRLPRPLVQQVRELARGLFLERAINVLAFGLPGVGKSHASCAIGHALVEAGHSVLFAPAYQLVQDLLVAKRRLQNRDRGEPLPNPFHMSRLRAAPSLEVRTWMGIFVAPKP